MSGLVRYHARANCELRQQPWDDCRPHLRKVARLKDHETNLGEFDVLFCARCKLGFTDPFPTEETTGFLYDAKDSSDFDVIQHSVIDTVKDFLSVRQVKSLAPHSHLRAVLDYATGNGRFALSAAKAFPSVRVDAVDYQDAPPQLLETQRNARLRYYSLADFATQDQQYDLIILRHVLEHTHHPVDLVRDLAARLAPGGVIYIEVPNLDSGCAKVFGKNWKGYYVPRHIFHYTASSLAEIVERAGLQADIGRNEMPLMGNTISILTGVGKSNVFVQCLGVLLHPLQLAIERWHRSSTCIHAVCRHANAVIPG